ncbi:MAG: LytR family transcriptional regulator [Anaerolineae bacterium]|nr:MAG: LytR family transcriptional regulator [Anaerolineae bacterium]
MQQPQFQPFRPYPPRRKKPSGWRTSCYGCLTGCGVMLVLSMFMCICGTLTYIVSPPPTSNILILGIDNRTDSAEPDSIARTDSIMILSINPKKQKVSVLSIPRDLFIETPNYGYLRVNTIIREAELANEGTGIEELATSLENTFGIEIDHYARLNFEAFVDVVDAVGGVKIDVPKRIEDYEYPTEDYGTMYIEFDAGKQKMDGETALIYARTRHGDSDYDRAARQQQVISALIGKLINPLNVYRWPGLLNAVWDNVETDMNLGNMIAILPGIGLYGHNPDRFVIDRDYIASGSTPNVEKMRPWIESHMK